jgi:uncharacterized membrane-anchored protein
MVRTLSLAALLLAAGLGSVCADAPASPADRMAAAQKLADGLHYQQGEITLQSGLAKIKLPPGFRYLDGKDAQTVLSKIWSNPDSGSHTLGMLVPTGADLLGRDAWVVVITYDEDGYVKDNDALKINYDDLLKKMKDGIRDASKERQKQGYGSMELVGWAEPPRYDAATHKLYWAKELKFDGSAEDTLNYNIRMLGRRGVLVLNAVAGMDQIDAVKQAAPSILSMVDFQEGHRYADFNASTDKVATYGIAALVAGGILAKVGAFKGLIALLIAAKKFVIIAVAAIAAAFKKFFSKVTRRDKSTDIQT